MLRLATVDDEDAMTDLIRRSVFGQLNEFHPPDTLEAAMGAAFGLDRQLIADNTYFAVERDGRIVGCGGWSKRNKRFGPDSAGPEQSDALLDPATDPARIRAFFVDPAYARQGIGTELMQACEQAIAESAFTRIQIAATLAGERLYAKFGYETVDRTELPLDNGDTTTVVQMVKAL